MIRIFNPVVRVGDLDPDPSNVTTLFQKHKFFQPFSIKPSQSQAAPSPAGPLTSRLRSTQRSIARHFCLFWSRAGSGNLDKFLQLLQVTSDLVTVSFVAGLGEERHDQSPNL
jgi:hypothetical protein